MGLVRVNGRNYGKRTCSTENEGRASFQHASKMMWGSTSWVLEKRSDKSI